MKAHRGLRPVVLGEGRLTEVAGDAGSQAHDRADSEINRAWLPLREGACWGLAGRGDRFWEVATANSDGGEMYAGAGGGCHGDLQAGCPSFRGGALVHS